jgi:hypothetical protein
MAAAGRAGQNDEPLVETLHAAIEAREGRQLKVVFAAEGQPALLFKPGAGSWNWSATSKLVIPIDNPLETLKTIRALLEKLQAQDPGLAPLSITVRGPYAGGDLPAEISMSSSRRSDRARARHRFLG